MSRSTRKSGVVKKKSSTDSRTRIADATIREILKKGVLGLRLGAVAKSANVSIPLIYKYYGSREGLIAEVLASRIEADYLIDTAQIFTLHFRTDAKTSDAAEVFPFLPKPEEEWRSARRWLRLEAKAASRRIPLLRERLARAMQKIEAENTRLIDEGRRASGNKSPVPSATLTWMFMAFADGFTNRDMLPDWITDDDYQQLIVSIMREHIF